MRNLPDGRYSVALALAILMATQGCTPREDTAREPAALGPRPAEPQLSEVGDPDQIGDIDDVDVIKIVVPEPQRIEPGESVSILVRVDRPTGAGEVRLTLVDLPPGIEVVGEELLVRAEQRTHLLVLRATERAEGIVDAPVTILATSEGYPDVRHVFRLTVTGARSTLAQPARATALLRT